MKKKQTIPSQKAESVISKASNPSGVKSGNKTLRTRTPMRKIVFKDDM